MPSPYVRLSLLAMLSIAYGCQSALSNNPVPLPSSRSTSLPSPSALTPTPAPTVQPSIAPSPSPSPSPSNAFKTLNAAEIQEVKDSPLVAANNRFGFRLFNQIYQKDKNNLFLSPLSVSLALMLTLNGADGETRKEMAKALEVPDLPEDKMNHLASLLTRKLVRPADDIQLELANSLWANQDYSFFSGFLSRLKDNFGAEVRQISFQDFKNYDVINQWGSDKTHGKIPKMMPDMNPNEFAETVSVLANAIYFKADWTLRFEEFETHERPFTLVDGKTKPVKMMRQFNSFRYLPPTPSLGNAFQAIELPYGKNKSVGLYVFLPSEGSSLDETVQFLSQADTISLFGKFFFESGSLILPKFKQEFERELAKDMKALGMKQAFEELSANFLRLSKPKTPKENFYISNITHKSFIQLDEQGTEAAATTVISLPSSYSSSEPMRTLEMIVDKPFVYLIRDNETGQILFMGTVTDPQQ